MKSESNQTLKGWVLLFLCVITHTHTHHWPRGHFDFNKIFWIFFCYLLVYTSKPKAPICCCFFGIKVWQASTVAVFDVLNSSRGRAITYLFPLAAYNFSKPLTMWPSPNSSKRGLAFILDPGTLLWTVWQGHEGSQWEYFCCCTLYAPSPMYVLPWGGGRKKSSLQLLSDFNRRANSPTNFIKRLKCSQCIFSRKYSQDTSQVSFVLLLKIPNLSMV